MKRILIACEYSATVRDAFRARGFDAWSCNLLPTDGDPRWQKLDEAAAFFRALWDAPIGAVAIENPVMHKYAKERIGLHQTQTIQPYQFGHLEQKATCLWLRGLPKLKPTSDLKGALKSLPDNQRQRLHYLPPSADRWKLRSKTYQGIADAMAEQWGDYIMKGENQCSKQ
jgi:hypothetical protein